jgi:CTD small phosphatase-like protein 2
MYIKDLRIIRNRSLSNIVLADNAAYSYYFQLDNGIPVVPFYNNKKDCVLLSLEHFLIQDILPAEDVREVLRRKFKLSKYGEFNNPVKMIDSLYF